MTENRGGAALVALYFLGLLLWEYSAVELVGAWASNISLSYLRLILLALLLCYADY